MKSDGSDGPPIPQFQSAFPIPPDSETGAEAEARTRARGRKKLAIVGFAPSSYAEAPFADDQWDVWTLNEAYTLPGVARADRWFEIHLRQEVDISTRDKNHIEWLRKQRAFPIYMIRKFEDIPMGVDYPIRDIVAHFARLGNGAKYLTNTISYMLALALWEKATGKSDYEYIGVWGVDMAQGGIWGQPSEYAEQRPSCEFWMGVGVGLGVYVYVPPASDLLKSPGFYGYEGDGSEMRMKIRSRITEIQGRIGGLVGNIKALEANLIGSTGEIAAIDRIGKYVEEYPEAPLAQVLAFMLDHKQKLIGAQGPWNEQMQKMAIIKHQLDGAVDDCLFWLRKYVLPTFAADIFALDPAPTASGAPLSAPEAAGRNAERSDMAGPVPSVSERFELIPGGRP
jgi:hypothetical protein